MFGVLNLNKPSDVTSRDVVNVVQRLVKPAKVGHAGTLDPMATGVLLVCVGGATRLISMLQKAPKTYIAEFTLGQRSDTDDSTGNVECVAVETPPVREAVETALQSFVGEIEQVPPAYSAVKVSGQRAYAKARRGEEVQLSAKRVTVHRIQILHFNWPVMTVEIECGSGTYIRSIARDLGEQLGCGGLMSALQRVRIGQFSVGNATNPDDITKENLASHLHNPVSLLDGVGTYRCIPEDVERLRTGKALIVERRRLQKAPKDAERSDSVAILSADAEELLAMAELIDGNRRLQPRMVFVK